MDITRSFGLDALVKRRIQAAIARGEFDHLPGAGRPLALDDDPWVPQELRVAYRLLKNAGYVPPELERITEVNQLLGAVSRAELTEGERSAGSRRRPGSSTARRCATASTRSPDDVNCRGLA
jgi:hypothetical protein